MSRAARTAPHHHRLQLLPQPALPEVPGRGRQGMARRARGRPAAGAVLSRGVHAAGADRRHRLPEQGRDLRSLVQGLGRDAAHDRGRSQASRRPHRHHLRAAHLGLGAHPSPARAHDRAGRRHLARRPALGLVPARILPSVRVLSRLFRRLFLKAARRHKPASCNSSAIMRLSPAPKRSRSIWRRCARPNGSSTQSARSAGPRPCWPICRAIPTASPSPTVA